MDWERGKEEFAGPLLVITAVFTVGIGSASDVGYQLLCIAGALVFLSLTRAVMENGLNRRFWDRVVE